MKTLRDFLCERCGKTKEELVDSNVSQIECDCGQMMNRLVGMPNISLDGVSGDFPSAADRWARIREDRHKEQAKRR